MDQAHIEISKGPGLPSLDDIIDNAIIVIDNRAAFSIIGAFNGDILDVEIIIIFDGEIGQHNRAKAAGAPAKGGDFHLPQGQLLFGWSLIYKGLLFWRV